MFDMSFRQHFVIFLIIEIIIIVYNLVINTRQTLCYKNKDMQLSVFDLLNCLKIIVM